MKNKLLSTPANKITFTLFTMQSISSAGRIAMFTILTIVGTELSGRAEWAGIPSAVGLFAAAFSAFGWGLLWDRIGRRNGLSLSIFFGALGLAIAAYAYEIGSFGLLLVGMVGVGLARSGTQLARFIASDVNPPSRRGRAISYVVLGGTIGAVVGPLIAIPSSKFFQTFGLREFSGPFLIASILFLAAMIITQIGLRPRPAFLTKQIAEEFPESKTSSGVTRKIQELLRQPAVLVAMIAMVVSQVVMTMLMGISSLHMKDIGHQLSDISIVLAAHTLGMFAFAIISGRLADRWGRLPVIVTGTLILISSALVAANFTQVAYLALALFLLGLGWNFCFVAGSALLTDQLSLGERSRTQGFNDLTISFAAALGSLGSGPIYAALGYSVLSYLSGALVIIPLVATVWWSMRQRKNSAMAKV